MTTNTHGFELLQEQDISELRTRARLLRHSKTGAELLSLENDDENKCFGIAFRTPPADHTGIAHILEHAVLCGSRRYPLKDPFVELIKGSLNTFLNAFTFPDKTCYPVASQNVQDFHNLINVYLDTVFYPRLDRETFLQQGWHYEVADEDGREALHFKGVVFNEMKGARSSPDGLLYDHTRRALFPDSTYGLDSGGSPKHIPDLTYEQLRDFHRRHYHPSNARLFFHGDDDPEERLRFLDSWLRDFEPLAPDSDIVLQTPFDAPRRHVFPYPVSPDEADPRAYVVVGWMLGENHDAETALGLHILGHLLIGTPASPLRKALIDSGLGEDLAGDGYSDELRQASFTTGLRNVAEADAEKVEALILDTLRELAENGIDPEAVEASLNTIEFALRENNSGSFPRGLSLMLRALTTWLHGDDPLALLAFEAPLSAVKARAHSEPYFENLIRRCFVDNPHRATVLLHPDPDLARRDAETEQARLGQARAAMDAAALEAVAREQRRLQERQETPDPPEALATLPSLALADLDRRNPTIPLVVSLTDGGETIVYHDLWTSGILYLDLGFDLHRAPADLLPYAGLFGRALVQIGTEREDFVRLTQRINQKTGGIRPQVWIGFEPVRREAAARLFLRAKAIAPQAGHPDRADELLAILRDLLLTVRLDNRERFLQMALEEKARLESRLIPAGSGFVAGRLFAHFHEAAWASEQMGGIAYLFFLRDLVDRVESDWPGVLADLERLRALLLSRSALVVNATVDAENWARFEPALREFLAGLPAASTAPAIWERDPDALPPGEGLAIPAQVNYVGKAADLYALGLPRHGSALVASKYLRTTYLWQQVRVQGGAYGGSCQFEHRSGLFGLLSYRDPNLLQTLDVYDRAGEFLRQADISDQELTRTIIGVIGDLDQYQLPDARGFTSLTRWLSGETDIERQSRRDEILTTTAADLAAFAEALLRIRDSGVVAALGSPAALDAANAERPGLLRITKVL